MTLIVAHRGASADRPENTMEAFRLGVELGADAIECDVHLTRDDKLAVIHDPTLERTTDRDGAVRELTMAAIRRADAGARFTAADGSTPYAGTGLKVPTLAEVLKWLPDGTGLVLEIKAREATEPAIAALRASRVRATGKAVVISFDEAAIERARELDPGLTTGYLLVPGQPIEPALTWATEHGHAGVFPWEGDLGIDPGGVVTRARLFGMQIGCYVVNDPERMRVLAAYGVWGFVTDVPGVARATLGAG